MTKAAKNTASQSKKRQLPLTAFFGSSTASSSKPKAKKQRKVPVKAVAKPVAKPVANAAVPPAAKADSAPKVTPDNSTTTTSPSVDHVDGTSILSSNENGSGKASIGATGGDASSSSLGPENTTSLGRDNKSATGDDSDKSSASPPDDNESAFQDDGDESLVELVNPRDFDPEDYDPEDYDLYHPDDGDDESTYSGPFSGFTHMGEKVARDIIKPFADQSVVILKEEKFVLQ